MTPKLIGDLLIHELNHKIYFHLSCTLMVSDLFLLPRMPQSIPAFNHNVICGDTSFITI